MPKKKNISITHTNPGWFWVIWRLLAMLPCWYITSSKGHHPNLTFQSCKSLETNLDGKFQITNTTRDLSVFFWGGVGQETKVMRRQGVREDILVSYYTGHFQRNLWNFGTSPFGFQFFRLFLVSKEGCARNTEKPSTHCNTYIVSFYLQGRETPSSKDSIRKTTFTLSLNFQKTPTFTNLHSSLYIIREQQLSFHEFMYHYLFEESPRFRRENKKCLKPSPRFPY